MELKIEKQENYILTLPEEVMEELNIRPNGSITLDVDENGNLLLHKNATVEIDLDDFSKEDLVNIIAHCNEQNITFEQFVVQTLEYFANLDA